MTSYLMGLLHGCWLGFMVGTVVESMQKDKKRNERPTDDIKAMKSPDYKLSA